MIEADPYANSIGHKPATTKWEFDKSVVDVFDDMLQRSIPDYDNLRKLCFTLGKRFVRRGSFVVDLGCSNGLALEPFVRHFESHARFTGIEVSKPMLEQAKAKFADYEGIVSIQDLDLREDYPDVLASLTMSVLTLQFIPIDYRQEIMHKIYQSTIEGGAFIFVEKVLGASTQINAMLRHEHHELKAANGYSESDIEVKRKALEGVLVPVTARWNEELLTQAGFRHIDCFWRHLNFAGWIAIK